MYANTDIYLEEGMYKNGKERFTMISTFLFSLIPLGFPWFAFDLSIDGKMGIFILSNPVMIMAIIIFIISTMGDHPIMSQIGLLSLIAVPMVYIYEFITWHYQTITREINLKTSIETAQFGFYLGLLTAFVMIGYYSVRLALVKKKK